jgi:hypothetical protein
MKSRLTFLTHELQIVKRTAKGLQNAKLYAMGLVSVMLAGVLILSPVFSLLMSTLVVLPSTGQISTTDIIAASGSAEDIQAAVDWVAGSGNGIGNVFIPEGTFNFVEVGEPWMTVEIPAGVNLFGAPTERTSGYSEPDRGWSPNDQVVEWKTKLVMPFDAAPAGPPAQSWFFVIHGGASSVRISDIMLDGYRSIDPNNRNWHGGIALDGDLLDFRIDHCFFKHCTGGGFYISAEANCHCRGVVDHCKIINTVWYVTTNWLQCSVGYGITFRAIGSTRWDENISNIQGHYTDYTLFIEDCYLTGWRHSVASNDGVHYVYRHNTIEGDAGFGSIDAHGTYDYVGTRAIEVYSNDFLDCSPESTTVAVNHRGGAGVYFNNYATPYDGTKGYRYLSFLVNEGDVPKCHPHDVYFWNNLGQTTVSASGPVQGVDYFLSTEMPGYVPYPYPHPLTL